MTSIFPSRASIDYWEKLGNEGWTFDDLMPYYEKYSKRHVPNDMIKSTTRMNDLQVNPNGSGPINLSYSEVVGQLNSAWADAHENLGQSYPQRSS